MKFKDIKAILFDIDGTLIDTTELILQCYEHTFRTHSIPLIQRQEIVKVFGHPLDKCYKILCPEKDNKALCKTHSDFQVDNLHLCKNFEDIEKTLEILKNKGIKIAAVSARSKKTTVKTLELSGFLKYIDFVVSREDAIHSKPHPEPLLIALKALDVDPKYAVMVGDTPVDVQAGKNAGTGTIGVTYGPLKHAVKSAGPDEMISSFSKITNLINR